MKPKTLQRLLWRLSNGRPVVVDTPERMTEIRRHAEVPVKVDMFTDRRNGRSMYRMIGTLKEGTDNDHRRRHP